MRITPTILQNYRALYLVSYQKAFTGPDEEITSAIRHHKGTGESSEDEDCWIVEDMREWELAA